ncbi:hypothetical protein [Stenotrophomonas maltophilia]|uniref:hypothetical protein n=1 Tax=Stenotrophomonas maltophilia TaxID=40324 RepID=UPI0013D97E79|nr:hypothetical protein [Stenotrophomonas maltophilia]
MIAIYLEALAAMLRSKAIEMSRDALIDALRYLGGLKFGGKTCYAQLPVSVSTGGKVLIEIESCLVRFVHDTNHHKVQIDDLVDHGFHSEFSVAWQEMSFDENDGVLLIEGTKQGTKQRYKTYLQLHGEQAFRNL